MTPEPSPTGTIPLSVTVVIASRDRTQLLTGALAATSAALRPGDSMILVDSASSDPEAMAQIARDAGAKLIRSEEPGASRARNLGWRAASTELVAFTDDDCLPDPGWLERAAETFARAPSASFVTGSVLSDSTRTPRAWLSLSVTARTAPARFEAGDEPTEVGHGANMTWRKKALEQIDGFDECLGPGAPLKAAEDVDAFWRLLIGGGFGMFNPDSIVAHRQWRGRVTQLRVCIAYGVGAGALAVKRWCLQDRRCRQLPWRVIASRASRELLWTHGVQGVRRSIANGYAMGALAELAMLAGAIRGVVNARRLELVDGRFFGPH